MKVAHFDPHDKPHDCDGCHRLIIGKVTRIILMSPRAVYLCDACVEELMDKLTRTR